ncbi:TIGR04282 family arsenosugar biosynthesis glycosyltransferase [Algivirga pacifica]|uniref:TIGR04282 family arsenosugar biosynthesis glycosyltransferase n=1 Tax=Algivirga pacifica TaxID=1162670 RepID=A0ABP9D6F8_9BACT
MEMLKKEQLIIFVKNPIKGKVKTRLGATIGNAKAVEVYRKLLAYTHKVTHALQLTKKVYYGDFVNPDDLWDTEGYEKHLQAEGDLGQRMASAFQDCFRSGAEKVVIIGSDLPELTTTILEEAFDALEQQEVVIGPATDGGYYLLGMRQYDPILFEDIVWSTDTVFSTTIQKLEKTQRSYTLLPVCSDLDREEDLRRFPEFQ